MCARTHLSHTAHQTAQQTRTVIITIIVMSPNIQHIRSPPNIQRINQWRHGIKRFKIPTNSPIFLVLKNLPPNQALVKRRKQNRILILGKERTWEKENQGREGRKREWRAVLLVGVKRDTERRAGCSIYPAQEWMTRTILYVRMLCISYVLSAITASTR